MKETFMIKVHEQNWKRSKGKLANQKCQRLVNVTTTGTTDMSPGKVKEIGLVGSEITEEI